MPVQRIFCQRIKLNRLLWLGLVLLMANIRLPHDALFPVPPTDRMKPRVSQQMKWQPGIWYAANLGRVVVSRLRG